MPRRAPAKSNRVREADTGGSRGPAPVHARLLGGAVERDGVLEIQIPFRLELPNQDRGHHWSKKHKLTRQWEQWIAVFAGGILAPWKLRGEERVVKTEQGFKIRTKRQRQRRRVSITRIVSHRRYLSKDDDNRRYVSKPILDALNRLELLTDDRREWLEHPEPLEDIGAEDVTIIRIERLELIQA
jgi:hypothetical protein